MTAVMSFKVTVARLGAVYLAASTGNTRGASVGTRVCFLAEAQKQMQLPCQCRNRAQVPVNGLFAPG